MSTIAASIIACALMLIVIGTLGYILELPTKKIPVVKFWNGAESPIIGLGTSSANANETRRAIRDAIDIGYRHIDGAHLYGNEKEIGEAVGAKIQEGVIKREDIFITSKLWNTFHRPGAVEPSLRITLRDLNVDYVDLYLMHWPMAYKEGHEFFPLDADGKVPLADYDYLDTWKAMERVHEKGLAKNIGVSNFNETQLERLLKEGKIKPIVNQVECHPYLAQIRLSEYCKSKGIAITAYRPLGGQDTKIKDDPRFINISKKYNKTAAQVLLRYQVQRGHIVIPKSVKKYRLQENFDIFDFQLSAEDMELINSFDSNRRSGILPEAAHSPYYPFEK